MWLYFILHISIRSRVHLAPAPRPWLEARAESEPLRNYEGWERELKFYPLYKLEIWYNTTDMKVAEWKLGTTDQFSFFFFFFLNSLFLYFDEIGRLDCEYSWYGLCGNPESISDSLASLDVQVDTGIDIYTRYSYKKTYQCKCILYNEFAIKKVELARRWSRSYLWIQVIILIQIFIKFQDLNIYCEASIPLIWEDIITRTFQILN